MNVWLEKSVCLISTLEWNNLPPPIFLRKKLQNREIISYICDNQPKTTLSDGTITPTCIVSDADGADPAIGSAPAPSPPHTHTLEGRNPFAAVFPAADRAANSLNP